MRELFSVINRLAPHARTVLVTGETGTGKELVARALHTLGPRQAKLLRTLEYGELQRVGSVELKKADVRVVATTNRRLYAEIAAWRFRADLYYRLNVVEIAVPAALDGTGGNKSLAARRLGISRRARYRLIDKYAAKTGGA